MKSGHIRDRGGVIVTALDQNMFLAPGGRSYGQYHSLSGTVKYVFSVVSKVR